MPRKKDAVGGDDPLESIDSEGLASLLRDSAPAPRRKAGKAEKRTDRAPEPSAGPAANKRGGPKTAARAEAAPPEAPELDLSPVAAEAEPAPAPPPPPRSEEELREALRRNPRDPETGLALARLQLDRGDRDRAIELLEEIQRAAPDHVGVKVAIGLAYAAMAAYPQAESALEQAVRLDPARADARCELGIVRTRKGLYAAAVQDIEAALSMDPSLPQAHYYLGICHNQLDRLDPAAEALERAVAADPSHERAWYQLGIVYDRKGWPDRAREMYRRAREVRSG